MADSDWDRHDQTGSLSLFIFRECCIYERDTQWMRSHWFNWLAKIDWDFANCKLSLEDRGFVLTVCVCVCVPLSPLIHSVCSCTHPIDPRVSLSFSLSCPLPRPESILEWKSTHFADYILSFSFVHLMQNDFRSILIISLFLLSCLTCAKASLKKAKLSKWPVT